MPGPNPTTRMVFPMPAFDDEVDGSVAFFALRVCS
jgi:hypothetical protein